MMDAQFEHQIIQNPALGAEALWICVSTCYSETNSLNGISLPGMFLILPIVFHLRSSDALVSKNKPGVLLKVLASYRSFPVGLQTRMETMADITLAALSLGLASGCLLYDPDPDLGATIIPGSEKIRVSHQDTNVKTLLAAARKLGVVFAETPFAQLCTHLRVSF